MALRCALLALIATAATFTNAQGQAPIRIGDLNSYRAMAANMAPYRKGMELALEEVNASGGVLGRKLEIISRDDGANPGDAVRQADELRLKERVDILTGTILSHVGVAVAALNRTESFF